MPEVNIENARVLVVGGSGVLGGSVAGALRQRGARVALAGRDSDRLGSRSLQLGGATPIPFDLRRSDQAAEVIGLAVRSLGGLDGLVNAAGVVAFGPIADTDDAVLDELMAIDLVGPLRLIRAAVPHLADGFIVNITGVVAEQPVAGLSVYSAAKAGLSAASRALARELRRDGIHVLDARPPHTETGLAGRPIAGTAPAMPPGLDPDHVASVIVAGLAAGKREIPAAEF